MKSMHIIDLADCTEFQQTILSRPPRIVHGWVWLLVSVVGTMLIWSYLTTADQVVKARGRVRPVGNPRIAPAHMSGVFVSACISGRVEEVFFQRGDKVHAGDVLVRMDTLQVDQEINETSLAIKEIKSLLQRQLAAVFKTELDATEELEHQIAKTESELRSSQRHLENLMEKRRQWADVRAPVSGIVTTIDVHGGEYVATSDQLATVAVDNGLEFYGEVMNRDVGELQVGMPVRIKLDAFNYHKFGTLKGLVKCISRDTPLVTGESASYNIVIHLESDELERGLQRGKIGLGMEGTAEIIIGQERLLTLAARGFRHKTSVR